jgi:hypothetical protein
MGGEAQNVVRMNISVPRDLKARMDAVSASVNWSAIAAPAFEAKLLELEAKGNPKSMQEVIARLKAADEADANEERQKGREVGERWAKRGARPRQLRRLDELISNSPYELEVCLLGFDKHVYGIAGGLYRAIHGRQNDIENIAVETFWENIVGENGRDRMEDLDFASGFCEGALEVWDQVRSEV